MEGTHRESVYRLGRSERAAVVLLAFLRIENGLPTFFSSEIRDLAGVARRQPEPWVIFHRDDDEHAVLVAEPIDDPCPRGEDRVERGGGVSDGEIDHSDLRTRRSFSAFPVEELPEDTPHQIGHELRGGQLFTAIRGLIRRRQDRPDQHRATRCRLVRTAVAPDRR